MNNNYINRLYFKINYILLFFIFQNGFSQYAVSGFFNPKDKFVIASNFTYKNGKQLFAGKELIAIVPVEFGTIDTQIVNVFGSYSFKDWLYATANVPYLYIYNKNNAPDPVTNKPSQQGFQDIEANVNFRLVFKKYKASYLTVSSGLGFSTPLSNYTEQGIIALGHGVTTVNPFAIVQYKIKRGWFAEGLYARSFKETRDDYNIPDANIFNFKLGYAKSKWYTDARLTIQNSEKGNDIFSDDFFAQGGLSAFANNRVNFTNLSATVYYQLSKNFGISTLLTQTLDGRNVRKEKGFSIGLVYTNK
ncbi:hypothetical protein [Flavobacterium sp.]|uniref:hypothetical protein n=1 Tax=Flavobacterium sp. TaxID=239 RepID=UPI0037503622